MLKRLFHLRHEIAKFGSVGAVSYVVAVGGFNLLVHIKGAPLASKPITASFLSGFISILVAYVGNRFWTWKDRPKNKVQREIALFFAINVIGLCISAGCLAISRYIFDLHSPLSDNISANVIGVGIGMMFRFWSYRRWVFPSGSSNELKVSSQPQ
ncbi:MAG TPA: GtrA family protein [Candidatus Nanopelagicaceae bacterium]